MEKILSGKKVSKQILLELKEKVFQLSEKGIHPKLSIFLIGDDSASEYYSKNIIKKANKIGVQTNLVKLSSKIKEQKLIQEIHSANIDSEIHGIILQMPLPEHIQSEKIIMKIAPQKDVDGLHPLNAGKLLLDKDCFIPCTPAAVLELIKFYRIQTDGKKVVIIGRSNIVGKPLANLLLRKTEYANATVTVCHSHTKNLEKITKYADVLIAAIGKPNFVTAKMVKKNSILIDVGINEIKTDSPKGYEFVGDIFFENVFEKAKAITPVPGGIGSITTAALLSNVVKAAENSKKIAKNNFFLD